MKQGNKGKAKINTTTLPPKRGLIIGKIIKELGESIAGKRGKKHERGEDGELLASGKALPPPTGGNSSDDEKN